MDASERLSRARQLAGYKSAAAAARAMGVNPATYGGHENGHRSFDADDASLYAKRFKVRAAWLLTGEEPMTADIRPLQGKRPVDDTPATRNAGAPSGWPVATSTVPEPDVRAGAGGGGVVAEHPEGMAVDPAAIRDEWGIPDSFLVGQLRIQSGAAYIFEVYGDSMFDPGNPAAPGSLFPGDKVIADRSDRRPSPPGPFVLWDGIGVVVKLVEIVRGTEPVRLRLKSRNPAYADYEATEEEAVIIGRVRGRIAAM